MDGDVERAKEGIKFVLGNNDNKVCITCESRNPTWVVLPFCVLACTRCAGMFRELGSKVCRVRSLLLDKLETEDILLCCVGGNGRFRRAFGEQKIGFFREERAAAYAETLQREVQGETLEGLLEKQKEVKRREMESIKQRESKEREREGKSKFEEKVSPRLFVREESEEEESEESEENERARGRRGVDPVSVRETPVPVRRGLKKSGGPVVVEEGSDKSRLGFIQTREKEKASSTEYVRSTGSEGRAQSAEASSAGVVHGHGYSSSRAPKKEEGLVEKVKKWSEGGKKNVASFLQRKYGGAKG